MKRLTTSDRVVLLGIMILWILSWIHALKVCELLQNIGLLRGLGLRDTALSKFLFSLCMLSLMLAIYMLVKSIGALFSGMPASRYAHGQSDIQRTLLGAEKERLLQAINELRFDREMKKISEADFQDADGRYRHEAIQVMKQLDAHHPIKRYQAEIERDLKQYMKGEIARRDGSSDKEEDR